MERSATGQVVRFAFPPVLLLTVAMAVVGTSCSAPPKVPFTDFKYWNGYRIPGYYYPVRGGDTLASIAQHFGCELDLLARINNTRPDRTLGAQERVFIPRLRTEFPDRYYAKPRRSEPARPTAMARTPMAAAMARTPTATAIARTATPAAVSRGTPLPVRPSAATPLPVQVVRTPTPSATSVQPRPAQTPLPSWAVRGTPTPARPTVPSSLVPQPTDSARRGIEIAQSYTKQRYPYSPPPRGGDAPLFQWPAEGTVTSAFNATTSGKRLHMGIDIANSKAGTPVRAAYNGRVIYSDDEYLPSMGNMILIEHPAGWVTLYAHNQKNLVKEGDFVQTGQVIAVMGATGRATGQHLHFEVRKNAETPVDPMDYLPRR